ncbi:hypothetical protein ART_2329 [Arthrobacter sp. PAMC 25486]|nr:hypothetical protein ART_2329 [Arthrobacter sp. PAMC 25486]
MPKKSDGGRSPFAAKATSRSLPLPPQSDGRLSVCVHFKS